MIQSCSFSLRFYYVPTTPMTISLRPYYVLNTLSLRPHHALIWPRLCHDCFEQVQCCSTIITTMKTLPRSNLDLTTIYPFALRSYYAVPVCTTTDGFYTNVVRAWPSVMGVYRSTIKASITFSGMHCTRWINPPRNVIDKYLIAMHLSIWRHHDNIWCTLDAARGRSTGFQRWKL